MRITLRKLLLAGIFTSITIIALGRSVLAQEPAEVDLAFTYSTQQSNLTTGPDFWLQGGTLDFSAEFYHGWSAVADIAGERASNINSSGVNLTLITTTFGPRYTWSLPSSKLAFFGHALVGEAFGTNSVFPSPQGAQTDATSLAFQLGGGADFRLTKHIAVRPIQADWLRTQLPNSTTNVQNNLRLGAGIVFRLCH
jgi:opacity protein-like surface antigen